MTFGIHMIDINSEIQPPCTQFETEMDWETLIQSKDKPTPYLIMTHSIICTIFVFVIAVKIRCESFSIVIPLNQPRDLANIFFGGYFVIFHLLFHIIKRK